MKPKHFFSTIILVIFCFSISTGAGFKLQDIKDYVQAIVTGADYGAGVPFSTMRAALQASPDILKVWAKKKHDNAMWRLNEAMDNKDLDRQKYYSERVKHWEAVVDCFKNFKDCGRLKALIRKREEAKQKETEEASTIEGEEIVATGTFTGHNPGVTYRDATMSCRIGLDEKGQCYMRGKGHIKVNAGGSTGDFYFDFGPSRPAIKTDGELRRVPGQYAWIGRVIVDFRSGNFTFRGKCNWRAAMKGGSIKGAVLDLFETMEKMGMDAVASLLPSPLPFTLHYYRKK
jgi:hypothetical protein